MRSAKKAPSEVYLAVREVPRRFMGSRVDPKCEAELRELINDKYVARSRVTRATKALAIEAAQMLAQRRGWKINDKRVNWTTRDAAYERMIDEDVKDLKQEGPGFVSAYLAATGFSYGKPPKGASSSPKALLFTEFVEEMHEILREANAKPAFDLCGRDIARHYGEMMLRLEGALLLVTERRKQRRPKFFDVKE